MKKILSLIFVAIISLSFIACSSNYGGTLLHPEENSLQIQDYIEEVFGSKSDVTSDDFSISFSYKQESKTKTAEYQTVVTNKVKGVVNYDDGLLLDKLKLTGKSIEKTTVPSMDGKEKSSITVDESSLFFFESGLLDSPYVFNKTKIKSERESSRTKEKTMEENDSFSYAIFKERLSMRAVILKVENFLSEYFAGSTYHFVFINGNKLTLVESYDDWQCVIKIFSDGDEFTKIVVEEKCSPLYSDEYVKCNYTLKICDKADIRKPKDKKEYENDLYE